MPRNMLSFTTGKPIAVVIDKNNNIRHTIKVREDNDEKPDIITDNIFDTITPDDLDKVSRIMKLSRIEKQVLKRAIKQNLPHRLNSKLKEAYDTLIDILNDKLKKELEFNKELRVLPVLGYNDTAFDRHIFIAGASNSGKSYFTGDLLKFDKRKRPIILFSKVEDDKAFEHLKDKKKDNGDIGGKVNVDIKKSIENANQKPKKKKRKRLTQFVIENETSLLELPPKKELVENEKEGLIMVFDDIDTFPNEITQFLRSYQNDVLETGRHDKISVISTSHRLRDYSRTKTNLNEAEYVVLFPSTNQMLSNKFLKDSLSLLKNERENILKKASKGRYMVIKNSHPLAVLHSYGVMLL